MTSFLSNGFMRAYCRSLCETYRNFYALNKSRDDEGTSEVMLIRVNGFDKFIGNIAKPIVQWVQFIKPAIW